MKKLLFLLLIVVPTLLFAQKTFEFSGTWIYESNDTLFKVKLGGAKIEGRTQYFGSYSLTVKGKLTEDYIKEPFRIPETGERLDSCGITIYAPVSTTNKLLFFFYDPKIKHNTLGFFNGQMYLLPDRDTLKWELDELAAWRDDVFCFGVEEFREEILKMFPKPELKGFSVPDHAIMIRVKEE